MKSLSFLLLFFLHLLTTSASPRRLLTTATSHHRHHPSTLPITPSSKPTTSFTSAPPSWPSSFYSPHTSLPTNQATPNALLLCETSRDSPSADDVLAAARRLILLGDTRCVQHAPAFSRCTIMIKLQSAAIMICGRGSSWLPCKAAGKAVEDLTRVCGRVVEGVKRVGGLTYPRPERTNEGLRVVVYNSLDDDD